MIIPFDSGIPQRFYDVMYNDIKDKEGFAINPILLQPRSRGRLSLKSANPFHWPSLQPRYFEDPRDLYVLREGAKMVSNHQTFWYSNRTSNAFNAKVDSISLKKYFSITLTAKQSF